VLGGDLNPILGFCFPLFSRVLPSEIANREENGGFSRKQNCCKLLQVYVHVLRWLYPLKTQIARRVSGVFLSAGRQNIEQSLSFHAGMSRAIAS